MKSNEYKFSLLVGIGSSILWFFVLKHLALIAEDEIIGAVVAIPLVFILGTIFINHFFRDRVFHKLGKFVMVGILNTGIDFFVFDTFIVATGSDKGVPIILFKSVSFLCALFNSYEMNRLWTFDSEAAEQRSKKEFMRFTAITVVGFFVNVGVTFLLVSVVSPLMNLSQIRWDNVAAAVATVFNLIWNFIGYKFFVFKSKGDSSALLKSNAI